MAILDQQNWSSGGNIMQKPLQERLLVNPSIFTFGEQVFGMAPSLKSSGTDFLPGKTIIGGKVYPDAKTHTRIVWAFPLSTDVLAYTLQRLSSVTVYSCLVTDCKSAYQGSP